ncbi:FMN-binding negative transcriptional regulator [Chitinibacteraceae bacterium HSL-7]
MYCPPAFAQPDREQLVALMREAPLATLAVSTAQGLMVEHVPLMFDGQSLRGHLARANPLAQAAHGCEAVAVFHGPQHYITPSWYPAKAEHGRVVPTWNYAVVHAHGVLHCHDDPVWLQALLDDLTGAQESTFPTPWLVGDAPDAFIDRLLGAIVGIELTVSALSGKWKMSQNQTEATRDAVCDGLNELATPQAQDVAQVISQSR